MKVWNFWKNTKITRALSDHGVIRLHRRVCTAGIGDDTTCGSMPKSGGPYSDNPTDDPEADVTP